MKKQNLLKLALMMVAIFMFAGANAQDLTSGDYVRSNATAITDPAAVTFLDKVTVNKPMPFFVWPSAAYNPDYVATATTHYTPVADIILNVISNFAWIPGADGVTANANKNYVEISWTSVGNKTYSVTETPVGGLCPAVPVYFGVEVIAVPSATIVGANTAFGLNNVISSQCWDAATPHNVIVEATLPNTDEVYPYHFNVTYEVFNVNGLNGSGELPNTGNVFNTDPLLGVTNIAAPTTVINGSVTATAPSASNPIILTTGTELVASQDYVVQNNMITVYRITYNNVNAAISRKSDYLAARTGSWTAADYDNFSYYPATAVATAKYIISLPTPVTGPIYHIPNNFAY